jgi:hypothetical protein
VSSQETEKDTQRSQRRKSHEEGAKNRAPVILAAQEAEVRRIAVQSQPVQIV